MLRNENFGNCTFTYILVCKIDQFDCGNGNCILSSRTCDGVDNCGNGLDERNCVSSEVCRLNQFRCRNGQCLDNSFKCDGIIHCQKGEDEINCGKFKN